MAKTPTPRSKKQTSTQTQQAARGMSSSTKKSSMDKKRGASTSNINTGSKRKNSENIIPVLSPEERERMVQYAAYHIAEKDGFRSGKEQDYWFQAEKQIRDLLDSAKTKSTSEVH